MHTLYLNTVSIFGLFSKGGSDVGENKGWIQQTKCDELPCPEMCTSGWQYSDGNAWNIDASMKPTCGKILHLKDWCENNILILVEFAFYLGNYIHLGCLAGSRVPSPYDSCNTCLCGEDGSIGSCTRILCSEGTYLNIAIFSLI